MKPKSRKFFVFLAGGAIVIVIGLFVGFVQASGLVGLLLVAGGITIVVIGQMSTN